MQDETFGEVVMSDRDLMKKTLLRGEAVIFGKRVLDSTGKKRSVEGQLTNAGRPQYSKVSFEYAHWKAVMEAGLQQHRVGRFSSGEGCAEQPGQARIYVDLPPANDPQLVQEFHNRLMMLCQLPYGKLADSILKNNMKQPKVKTERGTEAAEAGQSEALDVGSASAGIAEDAGGEDAALAGQRPPARQLPSRGRAPAAGASRSQQLGGGRT